MQDLNVLLRDFQKARQNVDALLKKTPDIIGVESVKAVRDNFRVQGYDEGKGVTKWQPRKESTNKSYDRGKTINPRTGKLSKYRTGKNSVFKGSVYSSSNPILIQTHTLMNSIQYKKAGNVVWVGVSGNFTGINPQRGTSTSTPISTYGQAINEGLGHQPKRKFMPTKNEGPNQKILKNVKKKIDHETNKAMKQFSK